MSALPEYRQREYKLISSNKKAVFNFTIVSKYEAGIKLTGTEVKSLRTGKISLQDSYCLFPNKENNELYVVNMHIPPFEHGNINNHEPRRMRKLLLKQQELKKIRSAVNEKSYTLVPTEVYFSGHLVKLEIALVKAKKKFDKRESLKEKDTKRELQRTMKANFKV